MLCACRSAPRESFDLAFSTPPSGNPNPMAVLATLCQSAQSLVQMPFVGEQPGLTTDIAHYSPIEAIETVHIVYVITQLRLSLYNSIVTVSWAAV